MGELVSGWVVEVRGGEEKGRGNAHCRYMYVRI